MIFQAGCALAGWRADAPRGLRLSVNISALQFGQPDLAPFGDATLQRLAENGNQVGARAAMHEDGRNAGVLEHAQHHAHVAHQATGDLDVVHPEVFIDVRLTAPVQAGDRHPDALLNPGNLKLPIIGECQKAELFDVHGMDAQLVLSFDEALAGLDPEEFVDMVLVTALNAQVVCVGEDFRFGAQGSGTVATLIQLGKQFGFEVKVVEAVSVNGQRVSTSLIRNLLDEGDVTGAEAMLGRRHQTVGMVEHGLKLGRQLGFPTANMSRNSEG